MTFVIVGAGPTGVEMAGAIAEIARVTLVQDFRHIDPAQARVILLDAAPRVLPAFVPRSLRKRAPPAYRYRSRGAAARAGRASRRRMA